MTDGTSASSDDDGPGREASTGTVLLALAANLGIGIAKLVGGLVSGSAAMLAEAAHSAADTLNQVLLLTGLRRSRRPADEDHPFGYGQERYFWSLLPRSASSCSGRATRCTRVSKPSGTPSRCTACWCRTSCSPSASCWRVRPG